MNSRTILIVDDDADTCEVLQLALQSEGYAVLTAQDRDQAQRLIASHKPSIAFIDYFMGHSNLSEFIASMPVTFPVILMTGAADREHKAQELGLRYSLAKPFTVEAMLELVQQALTQQPLPKNRQTERRPSTHALL